MYVDGIHFAPREAGRVLPLVGSPARPGLDLAAWITDHHSLIDEKLTTHAGILFRGFGVANQAAFRRFATAISPRLGSYDYRSTPRTEVGDGVYTSTEYPSKATIPLHNEEAYHTDWPLLLMFCSVQAASKGGETPLAHTPSVTRRIPEELRERFTSRGVLYVRNLRSQDKLGFDLSWQQVFQTDAKSEVEASCRSHGIEFEWVSSDTLRTRQVCQAMAEHPGTGEFVWFNQAHLFHLSSIDERARSVLLKRFDEAALPRNAYYGDGSPIDAADIGTIREAFEREAVTFPWERGDVAVIDNMLASHGRTPFEGERRVLVAMAGSFADTEARTRPAARGLQGNA